MQPITTVEMQQPIYKIQLRFILNLHLPKMAKMTNKKKHLCSTYKSEFTHNLNSKVFHIEILRRKRLLLWKSINYPYLMSVYFAICSISNAWTCGASKFFNHLVSLMQRRTYGMFAIRRIGGGGNESTNATPVLLCCFFII